LESVNFCIATTMEAIPPNWKSLLLLKDNESLTSNLLQYDMPVALLTLAPVGPQAFFSTEPPNTHPLELHNMPTPPKRFLNSLIDTLKEKRAEGIPIQSLLCPHTPLGVEKHFDLYGLTYWIEVANLHILKQKWGTSFNNIEQRTRNLRLPSLSQDLAQDALSILTNLPYQGAIHGFSVSSPMHYMTDLPNKN
jgi:hypothetical protein